MEKLTLIPLIRVGMMEENALYILQDRSISVHLLTDCERVCHDHLCTTSQSALGKRLKRKSRRTVHLLRDLHDAGQACACDILFLLYG